MKTSQLLINRRNELQAMCQMNAAFTRQIENEMSLLKMLTGADPEFGCLDGDYLAAPTAGEMIQAMKDIAPLFKQQWNSPQP